MGGEGDRNGWKWLQMDLSVQKETKNTPWVPNSLVPKGFTCFGQDRLTKKRDSLSTVSLVREAGLEPARPQ